MVAIGSASVVAVPNSPKRTRSRRFSSSEPGGHPLSSYPGKKDGRRHEIHGLIGLGTSLSLLVDSNARKEKETKNGVIGFLCCSNWNIGVDPIAG